MRSSWDIFRPTGVVRPSGLFRSLRLLLLAGMTTAGMPAAFAGVEFLDSGNSSVIVDTDSEYGVFSWQVDGIEHLTQLSWYYRVDDPDWENPISAVVPTITDVTTNTLTAEYAHDLFTITLNYVLLGGSPGSGRARLAQTGTIVNTSLEPLDLHLFQYSDFDVDGDYQYNELEIVGNDTATQVGPAGTLVRTVATPAAAHVQASLYPEIQDSLIDFDPTTLSDVSGPLTGDLAFCMQWDLALGPEDVEQILLDHEIVPEPSGLLGLAMCIWLVAVGRRH